MTRKYSRNFYEVVWPWRRMRQSTNSDVWKKALLQALVAATVAAVMLYLQHTLISAFILTLASVLAVSGIFMKPVYEKIELIGAKLGRLVAIALAWMLLVPFYYLFFWPMALLRRGKSKIIFSPSQSPHSYWRPRATEHTTDSYKRQY